MRTLRLRFCSYLLGFAFTATFASAAIVVTKDATLRSGSSVLLNGVAYPQGTLQFGYFQYGITTNYGSRTALTNLGSGTAEVKFSLVVNSLTSGQTYHFRAGLTNTSSGATLGTDLSFTMPQPPTVITYAAGPLHPGEATLNATVNPNNTAVAYWFQHGPTTNYGSFTTTNLLPAGNSAVAVSNLLTGLPRGVPYHFAVVATNLGGQSVGGDAMFTVTPGATAPGGSTGGGQAFDSRQPCLELNFIICTNGSYPATILIPMLGEIRLFAGNFAPAGWAMCQGQLLSTLNSALFNIMGTIYGGDGTTNFALPNLEGRRAVNAGAGEGLLPWVLGEVWGATQETLTVQQMPIHTHSLPLPDSVTGAAGSGQPRNNVQPSQAVTYLIMLEGGFPTQGGATILEPFLGQVMLFAGDTAPDGSFLMDGQSLPKSDYAELYSVIGTNFGAVSQLAFNLPDLRSRVPLGTGQGQMSLWSLGQSVGADTVTMAAAQLPAHQHTLPTLGTVTGFTGSNQPQSLFQPSLVLQYLISTNGQIPSPAVEATNTMMGEIQLYAGTNLPGGWLPCDGRLLPIANSPALFGVISNWFGGDGLTTFALPNLSGRVPVGSTNGQPGAAYGAEQIVLTVANLPPHTHTGPVLDYDRWITAFGLSGTAAGFSADADADGAENGYEWATGGDPTNAQSLVPLTIASTSGKANIRFPRNTNATDVIFTLQRSTNLANAGVWTGMATNQAGVWSPATGVAETGAANPVNVTVSTPLTNAPAANYRLQIIWP